ncbi:MAG TPA: 30S ribosomal protein S12 methylthiotransferase RimO [bacterium]|nr:30S ribosomal protein S12 methylthiotransferase RimO [bacterium]HPR87455.1 30S ribosomal protein S12 methylthiotransferase RimO [bacterium]
MKLHYVSLGCPKNAIDLETILGGLAAQTEMVADPEQAEAILINTCAFITSAKQEAIETILQMAALKKSRPELQLLVSGCLPQRYREELRDLLPEVDAFFYGRDAAATTTEIAAFLGTPAYVCAPRYRLTPRHYAHLRIADGCDNRCSYCAIPLIKGPMRSRPLEEIRREAEALAADGVQELMLVAQDTTRYGHDLAAPQRLHDLLASLQEVAGVSWIRLLYTHPAHWYDGLIDAVAGLDKVVPYIDLPIQHCADPVLQAMGRHTSRRQIEELIEKLRLAIPGLALRTTLIVGFPGESDAQFAELREFIRGIRFERLGAFSYSPEEGTAAGSWRDNVSEEEKQARLEEIMALQAEISLEHNRALIGRELQVLVDEPGDVEGTAVARTPWDAPEIDNTVLLDQPLPPGSMATAICTGAEVYDLEAHVTRVVE